MADKKDKQNKEKKFKKSLFGGSYKELDYVFENLSMMLNAGMGISEILESLKSEIRSKNTKKLLVYIQEQVNDGVPFWKVVENVKILPKRLSYVIKAGEDSGLLSENLKVVASQQQKDRELKSKIRSALIYPSFVLAIMIVVGSGVAIVVLPKLASLYTSLKIDLPIISRIFIDVGLFMEKNGLIAIPGALAICAVLFYILFVNKHTKNAGQSLLWHTPFIKKIILEVEMTRFGYITGKLLHAGLPIVFVLESLEKSASSHIYQKFYLHLKTNVEEGKTLKKCFESYPKIDKLIPPHVQHMISAAEQSGSLSKMLIKIGKIYEKKSDVSTKNITVLIEPILLILVWIGVATLAFSVILPIYSLVGNLSAVR